MSKEIVNIVIDTSFGTVKRTYEFNSIEYYRKNDYQRLRTEIEVMIDDLSVIYYQAEEINRRINEEGEDSIG